MKKKTCNNIRMGSELRAFNKINKLINDYIVYHIIKEGVKILKGIDEDRAVTITEFLFNQPKFIDALEQFEFNAEQSFLTDGVAAIKDGIAFIPELGAIVDIGIDAATKILPQIIFLSMDAWGLKNAMGLLNNQQELLDQADYNTQSQEYQPAAVGGRRRRTRGRRRGGTRRAQKRKLKSRRKL